MKPDEGRIPPQNIDAEASLLGSVLLDDASLSRFADQVAIDDFYDERHRIIFSAMRKLYERQQSIDLLTLTNILQEQNALDKAGGASYLADLTNMVPSAAHAEHYAEIVRSKGMRRRLLKASDKIINLSFNENEDIGLVMEEAERQLFSVSNQLLRQDMVSVEQILGESFDRLDELHRNKDKIRGLPTGFKDLDNMLAGLQASDMIVIAARPAMGKSTLALNIAHHIALKAEQPVLIFSLEMSKEQLVDRLLSGESGVNAWNIRTGNLTDSDFEKLGQAMGTLSEAPIFIDDTPGISVLEVRTKARREQQKHPIGLILVDYLQLMSGSAKGEENRVQEISEISRGLKGIARELNVPLIAISQLSRSVESRNPQIPQLADLRESGSIEQDADVVMFIYREDYYNPDTDRQHITEVHIKKHRNGPTGKVELYFHPERLQFRSLESVRDLSEITEKYGLQ